MVIYQAVWARLSAQTVARLGLVAGVAASCILLACPAFCDFVSSEGVIYLPRRPRSSCFRLHFTSQHFSRRLIVTVQ